MDDGGDGIVQLDEFIQNYFEKQAEVKERITLLEEQIQGHEKNRDQLFIKLKDLKSKQRLNRYGLDEDAVLSVRVVEARDLMPMDITGKSDPYCVLTFGKQSSKTNFIKQDLNPVWNEIFAFDVETGKEMLDIQVYDKDDFGKDDYLGQMQIYLDEFKD